MTSRLALRLDVLCNIAESSQHGLAACCMELSWIRVTGSGKRSGCSSVFEDTETLPLRFRAIGDIRCWNFDDCQRCRKKCHSRQDLLNGWKPRLNRSKELLKKWAGVSDHLFPMSLVSRRKIAILNGFDLVQNVCPALLVRTSAVSELGSWERLNVMPAGIMCSMSSP